MWLCGLLKCWSAPVLHICERIDHLVADDICYFPYTFCLLCTLAVLVVVVFGVIRIQACHSPCLLWHSCQNWKSFQVFLHGRWLLTDASEEFCLGITVVGFFKCHVCRDTIEPSFCLTYSELPILEFPIDVWSQNRQDTYWWPTFFPLQPGVPPTDLHTQHGWTV